MVVFDPPLLIYGIIQKLAPPEEIHLVSQAAELIRRVGDKKARIVVPAPALAEFLAGLPTTMRNARILGDLSTVRDFDAHAAQIAADLQANKALMKEVQSVHEIRKQCLKVDTMIIATAIDIKANTVYTNDPHLKLIAQGRSNVMLLEQIPYQTNLLEDL